MTQEGIRGNEEMPDADHNTILPFTRFLAGPADYTICYYRKDIKNTHAHQLALSVVYYSPIQFLYWYDQPSAYQGEPEIEFFDKVKTVWDETKVLNGQVGEYITVARRNGADWFVGAITNNQARKITVPTTFLQKGKKYIVKSFQDDDIIQTRTKVAVKEQKIKGGDVLTFELKASGGVTLLFSEMNKN
jgi:alpha-glucosidase